MKVCGYCGAENEDPYILCVGCNEELPRKEKLAAMLTAAEEHLRKCEFREAYKAAEKLLALNQGARMAWLIRGIAAKELRMAKHSMECFVNAGLDYELEFCKECKGSGQCRHCGEEGKCFMCGGIGYCSICKGMGTCIYCEGKDPQCAACKGTGKCPSCRGTGECRECRASERCPYCNGSKECHICGGTRKAFIIKKDSIPREAYWYFGL